MAKSMCFYDLTGMHRGTFWMSVEVTEYGSWLNKGLTQTWNIFMDSMPVHYESLGFLDTYLFRFITSANLDI